MNAGFLYAARCLDGTNRIKVGQTMDIIGRKAGWSGSTDIRFELLLVVPTVLPADAESHAHACLDAWGCRPEGQRKELFHATLEQVEQACSAGAAAVAALPARPVRLALGDVVSPLVCADEAAAALMRCPVRFQQDTLPLGVLMALSLDNGQAAQRMSRLGVVCTYRERANPEFDIWLDERSALLTWARAAGLPFEPWKTYHIVCGTAH